MTLALSERRWHGKRRARAGLDGFAVELAVIGWGSGTRFKTLTAFRFGVSRVSDQRLAIVGVDGGRTWLQGAVLRPLLAKLMIRRFAEILDQMIDERAYLRRQMPSAGISDVDLD